MTWLVLTLLVLGCGERVSGAATDAVRIEIEQRLDVMDTEAFFMPTWISSGGDMVQGIIKGPPEMQFLAQHADEALGAMLDRLAEGSGKRPSFALTPYFLFLGEHGGPKAQEALEAIAQWIESLPPSEARSTGAPGHPWDSAIDALRKLADVEQRDRIPTDPREAFAKRGEIVAMIRGND